MKRSLLLHGNRWLTSADESWISLFDLVRQVGMAVMQVGQAGTKSQVDEAQTLLVNTRRQLYAILARDDQPPAGHNEEHTEH